MPKTEKGDTVTTTLQHNWAYAQSVGRSAALFQFNGMRPERISDYVRSMWPGEDGIGVDDFPLETYLRVARAQYRTVQAALKLCNPAMIAIFAADGRDFSLVMDLGLAAQTLAGAAAMLRSLQRAWPQDPGPSPEEMERYQ